MAFNSVLCSACTSYHDGCLSGKALSRSVFGRAAFVCIAFACSWTLWANLTGPGGDQSPDPRPTAPNIAYPHATRLSLANAYAKLSAAVRHNAMRTRLADDYAALLDPHLLGFVPRTFSAGADVGADGHGAAPGFGRFTTEVVKEVAKEVSSTLSRTEHVADGVASAMRRPRAPQTTTASLRDRPQSESQVENRVEKPTIFQKLFGNQPSTVSLAYAASDDGGLYGEQNATPGRYDRWTAVYDISAHTVYLPDGTKLEAHSGRGDRLDDPSHVDERNRGATPPDIYDLELREAPFHGVQALRLIPVDTTKVFGRSGLLAHTYMLGPNGDSFGCVSFRNYDAFLRAYLHHEIKRLVVVAGPV
jgi:hypothetical protein